MERYDLTMSCLMIGDYILLLESPLTACMNISKFQRVYLGENTNHRRLSTAYIDIKNWFSKPQTILCFFRNK